MAVVGIDTWVLTKRNTVGPYREVRAFTNEAAAKRALKEIAAETPDYPYDGGLTYRVGNSSHHNVIYRIEKRMLEC